MDRLQLQQQRDFDRIQLVSGLGNPQVDTACLMSLVARLAGEGHTDRPRCASPLIGAFIIPVNDRMPNDARQRLKPFALRILGTRDGRDAARLAVLREVMETDILPGIASRSASRRGAARFGAVARAFSMLQRASLHGQVLRLIEEAGHQPQIGRGVALAHASGQLIALCGVLARDAAEAEWHWNSAIRVLDRLCDPTPVEAAAPAPVASAEPLPLPLGSA